MLAKANASKAASEQKSKNLGNVNVKGYVGAAGAGGGFGLNAPGFGPKVTQFAGGGGGGGGGGRRKELEVEAAVTEAWELVLDDGDATDWVLAEYGPTGKTLVLKSKGEGGLKALEAALTDGVCSWGGFRCYAVDARGSVTCKRPKFVFVMHKPDSAGAMKKAKMGSHKGAVKEAMTGAHMDVMVEDVAEDLNEQALIDRLQASTGAHKPNGYEFEDGKVIDADFYGLGIGSECKSG
jgi:hypothetical protein